MPNLYPTVTTSTTPETAKTASQVKFGKGWRFDFGKGDFVWTPIKRMAEAEGIDAFAEWCQKTLLTQRYRYLIYSRSYGSEFEDLIGQGMSREAQENEIKRMTSEALLTDPRTGRVDNFSFNWEEDAVSFSFDVTSARGESTRLTTKVVTS
ncbi:MAG: DUF2634 domain-containing protein [Firmicutes bacterium]|nr:DUF2634 domain-containing protein [Bacillota bacterium]